MIYGLYLSGQGAQTQADRLDVLANNLANASTGAFKRDLALIQAHPPHDAVSGAAGETPARLDDATGGVTLADVATDFSDGPLTQTGGRYDLALVGPGFFSVDTGRETLLTRNGRMLVNRQGELATADAGHTLLGESGSPIRIPEGTRDVKVGSDGRVLAVNAQGVAEEVGRINIVQPASLDDLVKIGNSFYRPAGPVGAATDEVQVLQGHLEESGVRPVLEMMHLIEASRAFETNVNMMRIQDESLGRLLQSVQRR